MGFKVERKYLAHYLDATFSTAGAANVTYTRIGDDLEELTENLNPEVESKKNILGENTIEHKGYAPQTEVGTYCARQGDALFNKLAELANTRATGTACQTTMVTVYTDNASSSPTKWAYKEDVLVVPTSIGGDTSGISIPFTIYSLGNRVAGTFDASTKKFTVSNG